MNQHYYEEERQRLEYYWAQRSRMVGSLFYMPPELAYPEAVLDNPFASRRFMVGEEQVQSDHQGQDAHASSVQSVHDAFEDPRLGDNDYNENPFYAKHLDLNVMSPQQAENAVEGPAAQQHQHDAIQGSHYIPIDPDLENQSIIAVQPAQSALEEYRKALAGDSEHPNLSNVPPDYIYDFQASPMNFQPGHAGNINDLIKDGFSLVYPVYGPVFGPPAEHGDPAVVPQEHEGQEQHNHDADVNAHLQEDDNHNAAAGPRALAQDNNANHQATANVPAPRVRPRGRQSHNATLPRIQHNDDSNIPDPHHYGLFRVEARPPCQEITRTVRGEQKTLIQCNRCNKTRSRRDEMRWHLRKKHYGRYYPPHGCHMKKGREQALLDCP
ncbi:hypothetical protein BDP55DRAFT_754791 [Colletotrichum godetiae]|uniref:C2H2-type domain-containing protein n=1 Tax=Colletotrichum godetiae TaxID=1209918 RepID=A0AAJ0ET07_9PEZI|nr:uncharacterized protein BDP55DRAFT_754791 [Colletotrichum godetiae]KAK1660018.1 hypothetical protein BDP55DRAFT_754791 [Colletotrichum godetiae]